MESLRSLVCCDTPSKSQSGLANAAAGAFRHRVGAITSGRAPFALSAHDETAGIDPDRKFVRVTEIRKDGFVVFEFSIGEPDLFAEMLLTRESFEEFCRSQKVVVLDAGESAGESRRLG